MQFFKFLNFFFPAITVKNLSSWVGPGLGHNLAQAPPLQLGVRSTGAPPREAGGDKVQMAKGTVAEQKKS